MGQKMRAWLYITILALGLAATTLNAEPLQVARIALAVGEGKRTDLAGRTEALRLGMAIADGDRITTGKDAVAIIVFADEGRVSLRADSELLIRQYKIDPSGAQTQMNLELVKGAIRQISGHGARLQPERYRLNTPIAAIGVRGTDFLAKATGDSVETFVHEGMIVVLPNTSGCANTISGNACVPLAAVSASDAGQYLRLLSSGQIERRAVNTEELERLFGISVARNGVGAGAEAGTSPGANRPVASKVDAVRPAGPIDDWSHGVLASRPADQIIAPPAPPEVVVVTPSPVPPLVDLPKQLVWGRFSNPDQLPLSLPVSYDAARQGRHVTVGEAGQYALWRTDPAGRMDGAVRGQAGFSLAAGGAVFVQPGQVSAAQIQSSSLSVDFDRARFDAKLALSHAQTGVVGLDVSGAVNMDEGLFVGSNASQRVAGALSRDGKEAGFLFSRIHELGVFQGVTLWNVR